MLKENRQHWLILAAGLCVAFFALDRFILPPLVSTWNNRSERITELQALVLRGESLVGREESLNERWSDMQASALPADPAAAENAVLSAVNRWARESHLAMSSLRPRWLKSKGPFQRLEFRATASGRVDSVLRFLHALESDPIPLHAEDMKVTARDERGGELSFEVRFTALARRDEKS